MPEYSFTGFYAPVGADHPHLARRGERCDIVGYDLDLERGVPLTFRVLFPDGAELHALPEEVDDSVPAPGSRPQDWGASYQRGRLRWDRGTNGLFRTSFFFATFPIEARLERRGAGSFTLVVEASAGGEVLASRETPVSDPRDLPGRERALGSTVGTVVAEAKERHGGETD